MPDDRVIRKPPSQSPSPTHTQRFRVPDRPPRERTGVYISHDGIADLTLKRVQEARLAQADIPVSSGAGDALTSAKNILRTARVEEDRLARFVSDDNEKPADIDSIRDSLAAVSEFATSAKFDHPEGGDGFHLAVSILYCGEPVYRRFLLSNAPIGTLGLLEKFSSCITGKRSITLSGKPGESRYIYLATPEIEKVVLGLCSRYPATDSTLIHLEEMRRSSGSAPVIDLPAPTRAQPQESMFMTESEKAQARKRETSIPAPAKTAAPPVREEAPQQPEAPEVQKAAQPEAPSVQEAPKPAQEAAPAGKQIITNTLGLCLEDLEGRKKVDNAADLKKMFDTTYSSYLITTESGHEVKAAEETRFATFLGESPEFLPACELEAGDIIYRRTKAGLAPEKISRVKKLESGQGMVLPRIRIEKGSMLFAEGFAVYEMAFLLPGSTVDTTAGGIKAEELGCGDELISFRGDEYGTARILDKLGAERGFLFRGMEIELTNGTRLLMLPIHPQKLADKCPAILDYADTQRYTEVEYENGKKIYYVLVKPKAGGFSPGFSLTPMENTLQILEDTRPLEEPPVPAPATEKEAPQPAAAVKGEPGPSAQFEFPARPPAPAIPETAHPEEGARVEVAPEAPREAIAPPSAEQVREEAFDEARKFAFGILGNSPTPPEEVVFGGSIAILVQNGGRHYLVSDADNWNAAREAMEKHLSSGAGGVMLTEIQSAYARKKMRLASGGEVTVFVKPVGMSKTHRGERGESHSDTLEMIPKKAVEAAIARAETPRDPESKRRAAQVAALLKNTTIHSSGGPETEKAMDVIVDPGSVLEVSPSESRRHLLAKTSDGSVYAILRFPCPPGELSGEMASMPAALVFTSADYPGVSYVIMEKKFLAPGLEEWMLSNWKAAR